MRDIRQGTLGRSRQEVVGESGARSGRVQTRPEAMTAPPAAAALPECSLPSHPVGLQKTDSGRPAGRFEHAGYLIVPLLVVAIVWLPLFIARVHAHQPNTDDYGYAIVARHIGQGGDFIKNFLDTGKNAPLVPALGVVGVRVAGVNGAMSIELPILLLLVAGVYTLARRWVSPLAAAITALVVGLNEAVLGYAVMLNFGLAATAASIWCFAAYLRSDRLRNLKWSVTFGVSMAALLLARSMAPVYVIPFVLVVIIDLVLDARRHGNHLGRPAVVSVVVILVLAGPWWLVSGPAVAHYLLNAGYQVSGGFAKHGAELTPSTVWHRSGWELANLGWMQSVLLGVAVFAAGLVAVVRRRRLRLDGLWMLLTWAVLTVLLLSTSTNHGTAFGLPVIAVVIVLCAAVLGQVPSRAIWVLTAGVVAGLAVGLVALFSNSVNPWWPGAPYRVQVLQAGGTTSTNIDRLAGQVAAAIGTAPTLMIQNDRILNMNGLRWVSNNNAHLLVPAQGPGETANALRKLPRATMMISGSARQTFEPSMNQPYVEYVASYGDKFRPVRTWTVAPGVDVTLWRRPAKR